MREAPEEHEALPVVARDVRIVAPEPHALSPRPRAVSRPALQAAAAAAGGFVAGAAVLGLVQRRSHAGAALARGTRRRGLGRRAGGASATAQTLQVVSSRTFLVDVHLLDVPGLDR
jgi:hypothetical protein